MSLPGEKDAECLSPTSPRAHAEPAAPRLSKLVNTGGIVLPGEKAVAYNEWPKPPAAWDIWVPPENRPSTPRTQELVDENTQLRWDVADADASFADMERGW